jgi:2-polyprenyl-3-methyl-5-hydroxy-6-metoxy-1,4-benzoquinol methylase
MCLFERRKYCASQKAASYPPGIEASAVGLICLILNENPVPDRTKRKELLRNFIVKMPAKSYYRRVELDRLSSHWNSLADEDAMWAVLSHREKKGGKWKRDEFLASGVTEISNALGHLRTLNIDVARGSALDFGCGVGRLSEALADHFDHVTGIDIAPKMIEEALRYSTHTDKCSYVHNTHPDLRIFPSGSFDFVYSNIVLQHMHPKYSSEYIREFVRVLVKGGIALFQIPAHPLHTSRGLLMQLLPVSLLRSYRKFDIYCLPARSVSALVTAAGGRILATEPSSDTGPNWASYRYIVTK